MALLKIARMGHPVLRAPAEPVVDPRAPEIAGLIEDMLDTMEDAQGTGLAAPQVHVPLSVVVYFVEEERGGGEAVPLSALINPVWEPQGDEIAYDWEGCLSVPGLMGLVPRHTRIRLQSDTPSGERIDRTVDGFHARVLQHECDHLHGILYPQRMDDLSLLLFREELRHGMPEKARDLMGLPPAERGDEDDETQ